jgi:hypothetical protein
LQAPGTAIEPLAAAAMPEAELRALLDGRVAWAGLHADSRCHFMNTAVGNGRKIFLTCPNGSATQVEGRARVEGGKLCTEFPAPVGSECFTLHRGPDGRFDERRDGRVTTTGFLLPAGGQ